MTSKVELGFMMGNVFPAANASKSGQDAQDAFQGIMTNMASGSMTAGNMTTGSMTVTGQDAPKAQDYQPKETAAVKESAVQPKEAAESSISNERPADTVKDAVDSEQKAEVVVDEAAVSEVEEEILTQTAEELDVTVEELEEILAQMGLTAWDLLEPENVSALVVQVLGDGDKMSLVTDENLSQTVLDLNASMKEIGGELAEKLGVDETDIKAVLDEIQSEIQDVESVMPLQKTETAGMAPIVNEMPVAEEQTEHIEVETVGEVQAVNEQVPADTTQENGGSSSSDAQTRQRDFGLGRMENTAARRQTVREDQIGAFQQTVVDTPVIQDMALEAARELMGSSPTEIINQINAYIRQNAATQITEWQMQLNPEHLGTVGLNVTAKEGTVTAQFTTQNEAVKAVMEAQVMILKENLEQQGIKVEAVEVTVASHEFEQNLQQGDDSNRQMEEEQENLRKATRKIDLGAFASPEDLEALDEAEQVTVEMMQADGNMMDYKV
ncbi:MAG: flagellar hook-length control protein FliK [Lachnospiraceae bacterium]|nr:flagellar hook-length control protein FliK [Lachnospiraceae bacterium]